MKKRTIPHATARRVPGAGKGGVRLVAVALAAAAMLALGAGAAFAWLTDVPEPVVNVFNPSKVTVTVDEKTGETKDEVAVRNTGDTDAWIRAELVVSWVDGEGAQVGRAPVEGSDYTLELPEPYQWLRGDDGLYYHVLPVAPGEATSLLVQRAALTTEGAATAEQNGWSLRMTVLAAGLQADPARAFDETWGSGSSLHVADGTLVKGGE